MVWSNRVRVVFADDGALMRHLFQETFESNPRLELVGFAKTAQEALDLHRARHPHIILVDESLLGVAGSDIIRELREQDSDTAIIGIVSSNAHGREEGNEMVIQGANSYVEKPSPTGHPAEAIKVYEEAILPELIAWGEQVKYTSNS